MIGAGVFTTSGFALADLGSPGRVLLAWAIGGAIAMAGAVAYGALARTMPQSGGEYLFLARVLHPAAGFVAGVVSMIAGFTGAIALAARALASYAELPVADAVVAAGVVIAAGTLHLIGLRTGAWAQNAVIAVKLALLAMLVVVAVDDVPGGLAAAPVPKQPLTLAMLAGSLVWISLSFCGFNAAIYLAGDVRDAPRTVPRALVIGTALTTLLYLLLNAVFLAAPFDEIVGQPNVALPAARAFGSPLLLTGVRVAIVLSLFSSVSVSLQTGPRVYAQMAADGLLPRWFREAGGVPRRAILAQTIAAAAVSTIATIDELLPYLGLTLSLSAALAVGCVFRIPAAWWERTAAALFVLATIGLAAIVAWNTPAKAVASAVTIGVGLLLYAGLGRGRYFANSPA